MSRKMTLGVWICGLSFLGFLLMYWSDGFRALFNNAPDSARIGETLHRLHQPAESPLTQERQKGNNSEANHNVLVETNASTSPNKNTRAEFSKRLASLSTPQRRSIFLESHVTAHLSEADLPNLYVALEDEELAWQWGDILFAICVLEDDKKAVEVVMERISTPWNWQEGNCSGQSATRAIRRITMSIAKLAMVDPELSGTILKDAFSRDGAERILRRWR